MKILINFCYCVAIKFSSSAVHFYFTIFRIEINTNVLFYKLWIVCYVEVFSRMILLNTKGNENSLRRANRKTRAFIVHPLNSISTRVFTRALFNSLIKSRWNDPVKLRFFVLFYMAFVTRIFLLGC